MLSLPTGTESLWAVLSTYGGVMHDKVNLGSRFLYEHDCKTCKFLGRYRRMTTAELAQADYDLYVCPQGSIPTVIARYGNEPHEYMSGMPTQVAAMHPEKNPSWPLVEAFTRACYQGYLKVIWTGKE